MKIAILSFYSGFMDRGVETWTKLVKEKLGDSFDIQVFDGQKYKDEIKWNNKSYTYWRWLLYKHVVSTMNAWSDGAIVIPTNGTIQTLVCRIVTWFKGKPMIVFGHSGHGADDKWNLLCSPDIFVAFSDYQKKWAKKFKMPWTKVVVIPHAVDIDSFTPAKNKVKEDIVLCVAANDPGKRIDLVSRAVELIPGAKFMVVGKGNAIEANFSQMPEIYKKAKVFCFVPNPWEAFGLVFLEAMATNLPIVTTNDPIRREIVGDAGILVDNPEDPKELAGAIKIALKKDWGNKPRLQAEKYSWNKIIPKYNELFNSLIKK